MPFTSASAMMRVRLPSSSRNPKDKQDILDAITEAQDRAQRQQDRENWAHVADEKAVVHEMVKTKALKPDAVSADAPTVR